MRQLRAGFRLIFITLLTAIIYVLKLVGTPIRFFSESAYQAWRDGVFALWARHMTWLIGMKPEMTGTLPERPFFLVTNHLGYVDIILLARYLRGIFVAKHEIAGWPVVGRIVASVNTIFIDRKRKRDVLDVNREIRAALDRGEGIILFPEGTSSSGETVLPLMPSLLDIPASRGFPVFYAGIRYETPQGEAPPADTVCWWGDDPFGPHVLRLLKLPGFRAYLSFAPEPITGSNRKELAKELREGILRECSGTE